ncbi:recombinase family protein [Nocardia wallacei]|uniref:recombinase family protein n=1 Tax=Nocardia wallacei TaxID=480035 RepID=UPI00313D37EF
MMSSWRATGGVRLRSFARHLAAEDVPAGHLCNGCRVRGNVNLSEVRNTLPGHANRLLTVSTRDQHPDAQHDALTVAGCEQIFIDLVVLDQGIDTSTAVGRMFFQILGEIAEFEHALMSERTRDGLAAARARGRTGGQKPKLGPRQVALARQMYDELDEHGKRRYTVDRIATEFGVTRPTIYRHLNKSAP